MKKILMLALAATAIAAPMADAKDLHKKKPVHYNQHVQHHPKGQHYPKGWGPNRRPDHAGYYHGYRGYHDHRPGYRHGKDGLWYPAAAFAIGAIIGGALSN